MRDIKFRAWDKKFKKMVGLKGVQDFFSIRSDGLPSNDNYELMQYTGLKDKNGKEIYEGDIVKDKYGLKIVYFSKGAFYLQDHDVLYWLHDYNFYIEVIGTIYENPELLEDK